MKYRIKEIFEQQTNQSELEVDFITNKINSSQSVNISIGTILITGAKTLVIDLSDSVSVNDEMLKSFKGVTIQKIIRKDSRNNITFILQDSTLYDIFCLFINDVVEECNDKENEQEIITIIYRKITKWSQLFGKVRKGGLTPNQQVGLYGELLFIKLLLKEKIDSFDVIKSWVGPQGDNQDFFINNSAVEIKTSIKNHPLIKISNEYQLDKTNRENLHLVLFELDRKNNDDNTLPSLIYEIEHLLEHDSLIEGFYSNLEIIGYHPSDDKLYSNTSYYEKNILTYEVTDEFPKILSSNTNKQIVNISYEIELSAIQNYIIDNNKPFDIYL
ncbi:PD-(D/E)XK motif protein [Flammeovirga yaeyamensis]|uniref:PD-(D/E)XK motif protein n=1 Tax=Flammeovirga yaeyamensis TaxID=367791 RepID=A0AAX1MZ52_9BACT|nr:PD-(D/E)XK motif protein [Flammeovirga yaeyamensis]MBB3695927.1 hypothetical protein [Flammeovirga yaeyamensis]NMF34615.1 PD-(D/E)XK motif protein [Flammeovirga yaeyamensis]QWG00555.1 PD-(D/E)XK motif protein [Flammeovirga yaeyamensis]